MIPATARAQRLTHLLVVLTLLLPPPAVSAIPSVQPPMDLSVHQNSLVLAPTREAAASSNPSTHARESFPHASISGFYLPVAPVAARNRPASTDHTIAVDLDTAESKARLAPLAFIENVGQINAQARFQLRSTRSSMFFAPDGIWVTLAKTHTTEPTVHEVSSASLAPSPSETPSAVATLRLIFEGANPHPFIEGFNQLKATISYYIGNDPSKWHTSVPTWAGIRYVDLYPGVDLEVTSLAGEWTWRLVAQDNAPLKNIRLRVEGAQKLAIEGNQLILTTTAGQIAMPLIQIVDDLQLSVLSANGVGEIAPEIVKNVVLMPFALLKQEESSLPRTRNQQAPIANISTLLYSTYLGGNAGTETEYGVVVDTNRNAYITGETRSSSFPTQSAYDNALSGSSDAFVSKFDATGALIYSTYLGGNGSEIGYDIIVNVFDGAAYIVGETSSDNFPTQSAYQSEPGGGIDAFVTGFNSDGTLNYSTYLGGTGDDSGRAIDFDNWICFDCLLVNAVSRVYITGQTKSSDFPTTAQAYDFELAGTSDAFVSYLDGPLLRRSTYLGGSGDEIGLGIASINSEGVVYVVGQTTSNNFPIEGAAFDTSLGGASDAFFTGWSVNSLGYSTYLGGDNGTESANGISMRIDGTGPAYIVGESTSNDFPTTPGAFDISWNGGTSDAFVTKLRPTNVLSYSTYLGGSGDDYGYSIVQDDTGVAHIAGRTSSTDFPTTTLAYAPTHNGNSDAFVAEVSTDGASLEYATYLGGSSSDSGRGIALDSRGVTYLVGETSSSEFPTKLAYDPSLGGTTDAFFTKLAGGVLLDRMIRSPDCPCISAYGDRNHIAMPIDTLSGNYTYRQLDQRLSTLGGSLSFEHSYSSDTRSIFTGPPGYGWTHNHLIRLVFPGNPGGVSGQVQLQMPGGSHLPFFDDGGGKYSPYFGVNAQMSQFTPGGTTFYVVTATNQTVYTFNATGQVTQTVSPAGHVITYTYFPTGPLQSVQSYGRFLNLAYDASSRLIRVADPINRSTQFGYNPNGDLAVVTDTLGMLWTYTYSGTTHLLMQITDPEDHTVERTEFDTKGRATKQYNGNNQLVAELTYGPGGVITVTDGLTRSSVDSYKRGLLLGSNDATGKPITRTYDVNFRPTFSADENGNSTQMFWSENGSNLERVIDAAGMTTTLSYDALNNLTRTVDARGFPTHYRYSGTLLISQTDALNNTWIYTYGLNSLLVAQRDPLGRVTSYEYDAFGQRTVMTDALGNVTRYAYDGVGRLITTTDALGRMTVNSYDNADNLFFVIQNYTSTTSVDPNTYNLFTIYFRDRVGRPIFVFDALRRFTFSSYDSAGRLITSTANFSPTFGPNAFGQYNITTRYGYDTVGNPILVTDTLNQVTRTEYDSLNRPITVTTNYKDGVFDANKPDEDIQRVMSYDAAENPVAQTDALGRVTRTWFDKLNRPISTTVNYSPGLPPNHNGEYNIVTQYAYDEVGNNILITDTSNRVTRNYYDALGRVVSTTVNYSPTLGVNHENQYNLTTKYGYDKVGNQVVITDPLTGTVRFAYDALNRVITTTDAVGNQTIVGYDAVGNRIKTTDGLGHTTVYTYDDANRLVAQADALGNAMRYSYDRLGNRTAMTDANGIVTQYQYDTLNRLAVVTESVTSTLGLDPDTYNVVTRYSYDAIGNRTFITNARLVTTTFTYDGLYRMTSTRDPLGQTTSYGYDALGNRVIMTDANGLITKYTYDTLNRLISSGQPNSDPNIEYEYDALGNRVAMTDTVGVTAYSYDALNRLVNTLDPHAQPLEYYYDAVGNRTQLKYPGGELITYTYDAVYRLITVTNWSSLSTVYAYDKANRLITTTLPNGVRSVNSYDNANRLTRLIHSRNNGNVTVADYQFSLDPVGNRTGVTETLAPAVVTDTIFADGFESGDLSAWSAAVTNGGDLAVSLASALVGTYGIRTIIDDTNDIYVRDDSPNSETRYRAQFWFDPNSITMAGGDVHTIFTGRTGGNDVFRVDFRKNTSGAYQIRARIANNSISYSNSSWYTISDATHYIEIDWQSAASGYISLWIDGALKETVSGINNSNLRVDEARLGVVNGADYPSTSGTERFDAFVSRTTDFIGASTGDGLGLTTSVITYTYDPLYRLTGTNSTGAYSYTFAYRYDAAGNRTALTETLYGVGVVPDHIFADGFESGDLSAWSGSVSDGDDLLEWGFDPIVGNFSLLAHITDANPLYVRDDSPNSETRYRARFYLELTTAHLSMAHLDSHDVFVGRNASVDVLRVEARYVALPVAQFEVRALIRDDAGNYTATAWQNLGLSGANVIEVDWQAAAGSGANNGAISLWVDGATPVTVSNVDNDTLRVDEVRLGPQNGIDAGTSGKEFFDAFESRSTSYIGPVNDDFVTAVITYTYDIANRLATQNGQSAFTWDANGNLLRDGNTIYAYDFANRLISTTVGSANTQMTYNGDGVRLRLIAAGVSTTYTQDVAASLPVVLQGKTGSVAIQYLYSMGTRPVGEYEAAIWDYLLPDALGSVRQIGNSYGSIGLVKTYRPYGGVLTSQGSATSIFGYTGEQVDNTGLVYLRARYMQPKLGAFLSLDPQEGSVLQPGSMNGWSYVDADPINNTDPSGNVPWRVDECLNIPATPNAKNSDLFDSCFALLFVSVYRPVFRSVSLRRGIPPALTAGIIAGEIDFDTDQFDLDLDAEIRSAYIQLQHGDSTMRLAAYAAIQAYFSFEVGVGVGQVHYGTWQLVEEYFRECGYELAEVNQFQWAQILLTNEGAISAAAVIARYLADYRTGSGGQPKKTTHFDLTTNDMAHIFGAYRAGIAGLTCAGDRNHDGVVDCGYASVQFFQIKTTLGDEARQVLPYFEYFNNDFEWYPIKE